jgi:hypothetical protein
MKKRNITYVFAAVWLIGTFLHADAVKGEKFYIKRLKRACGTSSKAFAKKHTQEEWKNLYESDAFAEEIARMCGGIKLEKRNLEHLYDFVYTYASDSGKVEIW